MSFDRRITPFRPDLADERLRGQVEPLLTPLPDVRQWRPSPATTS